MAKRIKHPRKLLACPRGRRRSCSTCGSEETVTYGNLLQAYQAARFKGREPKFCTNSQGGVHLR